MKKVPEELRTDITNTQYAGLAIRVKAFAYDYLIISGYIILLTASTLIITRTAGLLGISLHWPENPLRADLMAFVTLILPVILYFSLQESSPKQATWGKRKMGLRVVNTNGKKLTRTQALARSALKFLPWQIAHTSIFHIKGFPRAIVEVPTIVLAGFGLVYLLTGAYIASTLISDEKRAPYDRVAGSFVINQ